MLKIMVERMKEDGRSEVDHFEVKLTKGMTVLAVLETIYRERDPSIAFRFSCRTGLCATCNMLINHKVGLSCLKIAEASSDGYLHLSPLPKGETIRDLVKEVT